MLSHSLVAAPGAEPERFLLVLHGIFGSRGNWRAQARRWVEARPSWGAILVDLRMHGKSQGFAPPHEVGTAAEDLLFLSANLPAPARGVLGHSFGGKVAMALAERLDALSHLIVVDSNPGRRPGGEGSEDTLEVLALLRSLPTRWRSREAFVEALRSHGRGEALSRWLAMNLVRDQDELVFGLDLDAIEALLDDYFAQDLWHVVERPAPGRRVDLVIGGASSIFSRVDLERARRAAAADAGLHLHVLEGAGHWVHVDAPDALHRVVVEALGSE